MRVKQDGIHLHKAECRVFTPRVDAGGSDLQFVGEAFQYKGIRIAIDRFVQKPKIASQTG